MPTIVLAGQLPAAKAVRGQSDASSSLLPVSPVGRITSASASPASSIVCEIVVESSIGPRPSPRETARSSGEKGSAAQSVGVNGGACPLAVSPVQARPSKPIAAVAHEVGLRRKPAGGSPTVP